MGTRMKRNLYNKLKDEKGQTLVEFALVLILLLLISLGIVEFGRGWYLADRLKNSANIAARTYAVTSGNNAAKEDAARAAAFGVISSSINFDVTTTSVKVTVSRNFETVVPGILPMLGDITIPRDATYRMEQ